MWLVATLLDRTDCKACPFFAEITTGQHCLSLSRGAVLHQKLRLFFNRDKAI